MEPEDDYPPEDDLPYDDEQDEQEGMRPLARALLINLVIVVLYGGVLLAANETGEAMIFTGLLMMGQAAVNLVAMIVMFVLRKVEWGLGLLLSALILAVVGFSSCVAAFQH